MKVEYRKILTATTKGRNKESIMRKSSILAVLVSVVGVLAMGWGVALAGNNIFYVAPSGSGGGSCAEPDFNTIQAAVDAAHPGGDLILVCAGTYYEFVDLVDMDDLTIQDEGSGAQPIVAGGSGDGIRIDSDSTGNTIDGLMVTGWSADGFDVDGDFNEFTHVTATENGDNGIELNGNHNSVSHSTANNNDDGIQINGDNNTVTHSEASYNDEDGVDTNANANDTTIQWSTFIDNDENGLNLEGDDLSIHHNLTGENNGHGIFLDDVDDSNIHDNTTYDNDGDGIHIASGSDDNKIRKNTAIDNGEDGIDNDGTGNKCMRNSAMSNNDNNFVNCS